jgi:hypothetical protein
MASNDIVCKESSNPGGHKFETELEPKESSQLLKYTKLE